MKQAPLYIVDIIGDVVKAVDTVLFPTLNKHIFYTYGRSIQILNKLQALNQGITTQNTKYPLFALFQDFPQQRGGNAYDCTVRFPKISIAMLTTSTDEPPERYCKTFKPVLYPIYLEFLNQLVRHPNVVGDDPGAIPHTQWDRPGTQPEGSKLNEYLDAIEIQDLQLTFKTVSKCTKPVKINSR